MSTSDPASAALAASGTPSTLQQLKSDEDGTTAIEFALIATPFVMMLIGIVSVCLYFFTVVELDHATWEASRDIRTGIYSSGGAGKSGVTYPTPPAAGASASEITAYNAALMVALRQSICKKLRDETTCLSKLLVQAQAIGVGGSVTGAPSCTTDSTKKFMASATNLPTINPNDIVVVRTCYPWEFGGSLPFFKLGTLNDGSFLVEATTALVTERFR